MLQSEGERGKERDVSMVWAVRGAVVQGRDRVLAKNQLQV